MPRTSPKSPKGEAPQIRECIQEGRFKQLQIGLPFFFSITAKEGYDQIKSGRPSWNSLRSYCHQLFIAVPLPEVTSFYPLKERSERRPLPLLCTGQHLSSDLLSLCLPMKNGMQGVSVEDYYIHSLDSQMHV